jgi:surfeit locus 1 family protein
MTVVQVGAWSLRLRPPWLLLVALAVAAFINLGLWNWHRAESKRVLEQAFAAAGAQAVPLGTRGLAALPRYTQVEVRGHFDVAHQFLLDNMTHAGKAGYQVLTPLQLEDGRWLLVNRGWVPLVDRQRAQRPDVTLPSPSTLVTLSARIDELPAAGLAVGRASADAETAWPRLTSFPTSAELATALGVALEPRQLLMAPELENGYVREWHSAAAAVPPERNIGYAIQLWSFALLSVVVYLVINLKRRVVT